MYVSDKFLSICSFIAGTVSVLSALLAIGLLIFVLLQR